MMMWLQFETIVIRVYENSKSGELWDSKGLQMREQEEMEIRSATR